MRKTIEKEVKTEEKKEFNLEEAFVLWRNKSKAGNFYLSGNTSEACGNKKLIGYFISNKQNPKEPDIRIYELNENNEKGNEIASLWENTSKTDSRYLTGHTSDKDKEKLVAFFGKENEEARPYIRAYFKENQE